MPFLDVLTARRDLCRDLLDLSNRQSALIAADDYTGLLSLLEEKQGLLERLGRLKDTHPQTWGEWPRLRLTLEAPLRTTCDELLAETESLLADLVAQEDACTSSLVERRDATRTELQTISDGSRVNVAYRDTLAPTTHRHLDADG